MRTKRKIRKRNPDTPTTKENLISYLVAYGQDISFALRKKEIQERLHQISDEDIKYLISLAQNFENWIYHKVGLVRI